MKRERDLDKDYQKRIADGVLEVIMRESIIEQPDGTRVAAVLSGEIWDVFKTMGTLFIAGSDLLNSPTKIREFSIEEGKHIARLIKTAQERRAAGDLPFSDLPATFDA
ncbi:hypothetical protein [Brevundimonas sp.]|uniref:hypothetical protein n=1 Tax=Brevundimonas sp. TaxID=1871086 RepID=UPI0035B398BC